MHDWRRPSSWNADEGQAGTQEQRKRNRRRRTWRGESGEPLEKREYLAADLVAHWRAEELAATLNTGDTVTSWVDATKGLVVSATGAPKLVESQYGGRAAIRFDAADGADVLAMPLETSPMSSANDFTIVVVFATSSTNLTGANGVWYENTGLVDGNNLGFVEDWGLSINQSGQLAAGLGAGISLPATTIYSSATGLNDGQLHVATYTRAGGQISLYLEDQLVASKSDASTRTRSKLGLSIGQLLSKRNPFTGDIAEVRIYSGAMTSEEVATATNEFDRYYRNRSPVIIGDQYSLNEDTPFFAVAAPGVLANDTDPDGDTLAAELSIPARNGNVALQPNGSFIYRPNTNFSGTDLFSYRVSDGRGGTTTGAVQLQVLPVYDPAVPVADNYKTNPSTNLQVSKAQGVLANDTNVDNASLQAVLATPVNFGQLNLQPDGSFTYNSQGFAGTATFSYRVNDGTALSNPVNVTLVVNTIPVPAADTFTTPEDVALLRSSVTGVLANDRDADGNALTVTVETQPQNGTLTMQADGSFSYQPSLNFVGTDSFTYRISDGFDPAGPVSVEIQVTPVNDLPTGNADAYFAIANKATQIPATLGVLANDSDQEGSPITASIVTQPSHGTVQLDADGSFTYTPTTGYEGADSFTYRASDGQGNSAPVMVTLNVAAQPLVISEFVTSNAKGPTTIIRADKNVAFAGEKLTPDWIELRNLLDTPIGLAGLYLTDDPAVPTQWPFPAGTTIPAKGYLVVYASGKDVRDPALDQQGWMHTNFNLSNDGEYLGVMTAGGDAIHAFAPVYPLQRTDISFGLDAQLNPRYYTTPTPGAANTAGIAGLVGDTTFSVDRGFFTQPFSLEISTATAGATIRYTTNGSLPTETNGTVYSGPLTIDRTTTIRARAFHPDLIATNADTHTYVFTSDVVEQTSESTIAAGFPARWKTSTTPDYGLDSQDQFPRIAGNVNMPIDEAKEAIKKSLVSLPTLSLVMNIDDMFGASRGIYANPTSSGPNWERPTSVEWVNPDGTEGFQIDAGIRIQGGAFRDFGLTKKKSFRLLFKTQYGEGKLQYPVFGEEGVREFDTLTLRMESNDGWQWSGAGGQPQYARDEFMRQTQQAMGQPASHGQNVHLYINGFYWGMYNVVERPDESFGAAYFGADPYSWDGQNSGTPINADGDSFRSSRTRAAWTSLTRGTNAIRTATTEEAKTAAYMAVQGLNPDGTDNPDAPRILDPINYSDYLIANYYGGNADWPFKNYYFGRENSPDSDGFKFFVWDAEWSLLLNSNRTAGLVNNNEGVALPFRDLKTSLEFRTLFGDRVHKHFFNGGALYVDPANTRWDPEHPERNVPAARYVAITDAIYEGLIAESARWGDQHQTRPYTRTEWTTERNRIMTQWFPGRTAELLNIFRTLNLYPKVAAPTFSQRGGPIGADVPISLVAPAGTIYYTLDGSDPRAVGGGVSPQAIVYDGSFRLSQNATVRVRALNGSDWSAIDEAAFLVGAVPADGTQLRVSEVHYHPADPTPAEVAAGFTDADDFEFIELMNVSQQTIDLRHVRFVTQLIGIEDQGVTFDFATSAIQQLAPGERLVIVENEAAFEARYGANIPVAGVWQGGRLSNNTEQITIMAGDALLQQFSYDDGWIASTDGTGPSLEVINPAASDLASWSLASSWRASAEDGGSPGSDRRAPIVGDSNGDGQFNSIDLILVFQAGEYEDSIDDNSSFAEGDWNGDGDFTSADLVAAFQQGTYSATAAPAARQRDLIFEEWESFEEKLLATKTLSPDDDEAADAI